MFDAWMKSLERLDWPVFTLELRRARRSDKGFRYSVMIAVALSILGCVLALNDSQKSRGFGVVWAFLYLGSGLLVWVFSTIVVTSYSARAIASEREAQRFDPLAMTCLSSRQIVLQKAAQPIAYMLALAVVMLPLGMLVPWLIGIGFSWNQLSLLIWLLTASLIHTAVGLLCSCLFARAATATAVAYLTIIVAPAALSMFGLGFAGPMGLVLFVGSALYGETTWYSILASIVTAAVLLHIAAWRLESLRRSA